MNDANIELVHQQRQELEAKINHLETKLTQMRQQLVELEAAEQHDAVDHLETCLEEVDEKYRNLKDFGQMLVADLRKLLHLP